MKIIQDILPKDQYVGEVTKKTQIVLHHTVSGVGVQGDINWWKTDKGRVGTHFIISRKGEVYQMLPLENWIYHLGLTNKNFSSVGLPYKNLDSCSIGIELDSYGWLKRDANGGFLTGYKTAFPSTIKPVNVHYRGFTFYEDYYEEQVSALKELLVYLSQTYKIPLTFDQSIFEINKKALSGVSGVYSHSSYRPDKTDVYPNERLINMLKTL